MITDDTRHPMQVMPTAKTEVLDPTGRGNTVEVAFDPAPWGSIFPIKVKMTPDQAKGFSLNQSANVMMGRQRLRQGEKMDGTALWHYWWGFLGFVGDDAPSPSDDGPAPGPDPGQRPPGLAAPAITAPEPQPMQTRPVWDPQEMERVKRLSIERQVALKAAVELLGLTTTADAETVVATAIAFELYLATGEPVVPVQEPDEEEPTEPDPPADGQNP